MQFIIDFLPLLVALAAYKAGGIYVATIALMILIPMIPLGQKLLGKPVSQIHLWSAVAILVFGSMTLLLRDPRFVMAKPSIVYGAFAIAFLVT
ncbi:MAG: septation protein IspZ, partial [Pseudomonadota bacterium]